MTSSSPDDKKIVGIRLRPSWSESYLESLIDKAVQIQIFLRDKERGTIGLDPRFHELMREQIDWALASGYDELRADHVGACIAKYILGNPHDDPSSLEKFPEMIKMVEDKTFQDMCFMIRDFIVNATATTEKAKEKTSKK
jgi:hypothetical protein